MTDKMAAAGQKAAGGMIDSVRIREGHRQVEELVKAFRQLQTEMDVIATVVKENWKGKGRDEFEVQYRLLSCRMDDFGEALYEIYDALVKAEADYTEKDDRLRQGFAMSVQG